MLRPLERRPPAPQRAFFHTDEPRAEEVRPPDGATVGDEAEGGLLGRLRRRDERAFRELVERYEGRVRAYAAGLLGDRHEAEDAAQETFLRAFRRVGAFRGDAPLEAWMLRICRNHCLDRLRARPSRETARLDDDVAAGPDATVAGAEAGVRRERLLIALASLPEAQQQVIVLRELRGLAYEEVAEALGVPVGTVRSRLHAARSGLRAILERR